MDEKIIQMLIDQTLDAALLTIPAHLQDIEKNKVELKVEDTKEFVFGMIMGMAMAIAGTFLAGQTGGVPTPEDQAKMNKLVYAKIPLVRSRVFGE